MIASKSAKDPYDLLTDNQIVLRILNGEKELFEVLMRRNNQLLFRTIRSYFNDTTDVEDIMQETYIKAYRKLYQFNRESRFTTWLVRIGINEALQRKRKEKRLNTLPITKENEKVLRIPDITTLTVEEQFAQREKSTQLIEKALDSLPEKYKVVFILKEVEGMEVAQVAAGLQLSISNVKVRLHRARNMMKESILKMADVSELFEFGNEKCDRLVASVMKRIESESVSIKAVL